MYMIMKGAIVDEFIYKKGHLRFQATTNELHHIAVANSRKDNNLIAELVNLSWIDLLRLLYGNLPLVV